MKAERLEEIRIAINEKAYIKDVALELFAEISHLRAAIEAAPHDRICDAINYGTSCSPNCWKSKALKEEK